MLHINNNRLLTAENSDHTQIVILLLLRLHLISSLFAVSEGSMMSFCAAAFLQLNSHLFIHIFLFRMAAALFKSLCDITIK